MAASRNGATPAFEGWRQLYHDDSQVSLFGDSTLVNARNSPLFQLIFCAGSPAESAVRLTKRVANYLITRW